MPTTVIVIGILVLAFVGAPIFAVMAGLTFTLMEVREKVGQTFDMAIASKLTKVWEHCADGDAARSWPTVPLLVFAGYLMAEAKTADRLVEAARAWLGWFRGGLAVVTIVACAFFTTVTGASGVTIVAIGGLVLPSLIKENYSKRFSLGLVTGTGSIGLLFPPALPLIVFYVVYLISEQASFGVEKFSTFNFAGFLLAGIFPGLLLIGAIGIYSVYRARKDKVPVHPFRADALLRPTLRALPELILPLIIVGGILSRKLNDSQAAAVATLYLLILEVGVYRDVKLKQLPRIAREAMALVGAIFVIIVAATALTQYFVDAKIPDTLNRLMDEYIGNKWTFLLALNVVLILVGCVMDIFSAILIVVPLLIIPAQRYGIDPYHLGVIFLLNLEVGYVHPPVGLNLFIASFRFRTRMAELFVAVLPIVAIMLVVLFTVTYLPLLVPKTLGLIRWFVPKEEAPKKEEVIDDGPDAAVAAQVVWPDGGVWTLAKCAELGDADKLSCKTMFERTLRCEKEAPPDKVAECKQKEIDIYVALENAEDEIPRGFFDPDAGPGEETGEEGGEEPSDDEAEPDAGVAEEGSEDDEE